ncbi:unnamed protein product [Vicia faba]|uniref:Uncharacterized protein n=1 Tax=Vicia faba TaxID=3906 RepID=A0AAV1A6V6_VICFA|nr:unnamed protein product [Vicia faba]
MDGHTSPSMAWRDFPLTVPEVRSFILSFGRSLILERRKGINSDRQHPKRSLSFRWCGWGVETSMPGRSKVTCYCCCSASCSSSRNFFRIFAFLTRNWIRTNRFFPSFSSHSPGLAPDWRERGKALGIAAFVSSNGWIRPGRPSFIIVQLEREKSHPFQKSQRNGRLQYQKLRRHDLKMGRVGAPVAPTILVNRSRPAAMNTLCRLCEGSLNKNQEKRPPKEIKLIHLYPIG